jgi:uncharacterized protein (TIGR02001 family)
MKTVNKKLMALAVAGTLGMGSVSAMADISGNVAYVSDYVWRGVSQTANQPTVQGGFDYSKDELSIGTWASGLDVGGTEFDVYGSYNFGPVTVGAIAYIITAGGSSSTAYEINAGGDVGPVSLMVSYDPDAANYYAEGSYSYELSKGVSLDLHAGTGDAAGTDYSLGLSTSAAGLDFAVVGANHDTAGSVAFVSVSKSM